VFGQANASKPKTDGLFDKLFRTKTAVAAAAGGMYVKV
jgi:hypothetical protein